MRTLREFLKIVGGNVGQRERVLYTTWALAFTWGVLNHYAFSPGESALTILLSASGGVIASYTYRASTANPSGSVTTKLPVSTDLASGDPPTDPGTRV